MKNQLLKSPYPKNKFYVITWGVSLLSDLKMVYNMPTDHLLWMSYRGLQGGAGDYMTSVIK